MVVLSILYIIIPYFVHSHNYLLDRIIFLFLRYEIPKYCPTQSWRCVTVSLTGEVVKTYFCRAHLPSDILCIFFPFLFTRGSNNYFAYSPTKILYSKVKLTNGCPGSGDKWSFGPEKKIIINKQLLLLQLNAVFVFNSQPVSATKTSMNVTMLTQPLC